MAKECPKCKKENPSSANVCMFCGTRFVEIKDLPEEEKLRKQINEMQETIQLLKKALADAQQNNDSSAENIQLVKNLQKKINDMQNKNDVLQKSIKTMPSETSHKSFPTTLLIVGLALLLVVGGLIGYFAFYMPYITDRDAPRFYTYTNGTILRSSEEAGADYNKIGSIPYGSELIVYNNGSLWSDVKWKNNQTNKALKGYISSALILPAGDFKILNNIWGDTDSKDIILTGKCRLALLNYFKANNLSGWKVYSKLKNSKTNSTYFPKIVNPNSKFSDFAVIIKNDSTNERRCLLFNFDDDETPHLAYVEQAPPTGDIVSITRDYNPTINTYVYHITYN
jgi:hypothetical protein